MAEQEDLQANPCARLLEQLSRHPSVVVRRETVRMLQVLGTPDAAATLVSLRGDEDELVRAMAYTALGMAPAAVDPSLLEEGISDIAERVRKAALDALLARDAEAAARAAEHLLHDDSGDVVYRALIILRDCGHASAIVRLRDLESAESSIGMRATAARQSIERREGIAEPSAVMSHLVESIPLRAHSQKTLRRKGFADIGALLAGWQEGRLQEAGVSQAIVAELDTVLSTLFGRHREGMAIPRAPEDDGRPEPNDPPDPVVRGDCDELTATLRDVFGFSSFRLQQREIIEHVIGGGDAFVLMPTGGGKSLCYQIPALHRPGTAIVVSPLISLMKDQVDALRASGVAAACLNSSLAPDEASAVLRQLEEGRLDLLYVAPERLMLNGFLERLRDASVALFAIDEAHCVSQWGHDFRPEYVQLGQLRELFPGVPFVALTATADDQTREDVRLRLHLTNAPVFAAGFDRPNIRYTVVEKRRPSQQLQGFIASRPSDSGIVYCLSRKRVEDVAGRLKAAGISAAAYHAGLPAQERTRVQDAFQRDEVQVVVATVAFGMGIDKPDVRFVVHYDMPKNIEGYYQETGRAGRDGLPAEALLLFGMQDVMTARMLIENGRNPEQVRIELHKLQAMIGFAESVICRRRALLGYFGELLEEDCGNCDVCLDPPELYDATEDARNVFTVVQDTGQRLGVGHVIDVLQGTRTEKVLRWRHDQLPCFAVGANLSRDEWTSVIRQLIHRGFLHQDIAQYSSLSVTRSAQDVLGGGITVELARPKKKVRASKPKGSCSPSSGELPEADRELFEELRALRRELANDQGVPAYAVFADRSLLDMVARRPRTREQFLACHGVGLAKLERYGDAFLGLIAGGTAR